MGFGLRGCDLGFGNEILSSRMGFAPRVGDLGLKVGIKASKLGTGPQGWDLGFGARKGVMTGIQALRQRFE